MLTKRDIAESGAYKRAPHIARSEIRLLWVVDYWDGPRSGMLLYQGEQCWFEVAEEGDTDGDTWFRRCVILRLTPAQLTDEQGWHELFRQKVGTHWDYDGEGRRVRSEPKPPELSREFYEPYGKRSTPDYSDNEVLGWFET